MGINYSDIDNECIDLVKWFNENGLPTIYSCQGHEENKLNTYHIIFDSSVLDEDIQKLLQKYSNKYDHSPFLGKFNKWMRKSSNEIINNWIYQVGTKEDKINYNFAKHDLNILKRR